MDWWQSCQLGLFFIPWCWLGGSTMIMSTDDWPSKIEPFNWIIKPLIIKTINQLISWWFNLFNQFNGWWTLITSRNVWDLGDELLKIAGVKLVILRISDLVVTLWCSWPFGRVEAIKVRSQWPRRPRQPNPWSAVHRLGLTSYLLFTSVAMGSWLACRPLASSYICSPSMETFTSCDACIASWG